jgi:hypothetical protein
MKNKYSEDWNPEDWQGRRKEQVESGYKIMGLTYVLFFITLALILIF